MRAELLVWGSLAVLLVAAEMLVPGAFLLWLGVAAGAVFLLLLFVPLTPLWQVVAFVALVGARAKVMEDAHRRGHAFGNRLFNKLYRTLFGAGFDDIFSGYRAFSRRFVKSFPALSSGFEIETELCVHASQLKLPTAEISLPYGKREEGSASKLRSVRDGVRILSTFALLLKETRPAVFFGTLASAAMAMAIVLAIPVVETYLATGLVPRLPTAVLATGMALFSGLIGCCGLILDSVARGRVEQKRILYLTIGAPRG